MNDHMNNITPSVKGNSFEHESPKTDENGTPTVI